MAVAADNRLKNRWGSGAPTDPVDLLVYASNLLGSDPAITNFGGGNTSVKATETDPLTGDPVEVLWVKASGGDLGTAKRGNFASLYLAKFLGLERLAATIPEDELVPLFPQCAFNLNPAAPSIDTPLHAFVPSACVSHMHPDAVIAIAASKDCRDLTAKIWGGKLGFLAWKRPGFDLGLALCDLIAANPGIEGAMMESHGLICWADTWADCYALTLRLIDQAQAYLDSHGRSDPFGKPTRAARDADRDAKLAALVPVLRGKVAYGGVRLIGHVDTAAPVLDFLASQSIGRLAALGTSCPDHFLRTKIRPFVLTDGDDVDAKLTEFRDGYAAYYDRCKHVDSPAMRNPNPSVILLPGLGMVTFAKNAAEARITGEFYTNAINVMRGAEAVSQYVALPEQEAFNIEYWLLEEAKLKRQPPPKELSGRIAVISGGAQGIGRATAHKLAGLGATVALLDINEAKLAEAVEDVARTAGSADSVRAFACDVTSPTSLRAAFDAVALAFGGADIVVVNAGNARRGTVADTSEEDYRFLSDLLMKGYFDTMAEAVRLFQRQGMGGNIVVVGSKNGVAVGSNAALYSAAKAFELHLMRTVALDFAKQGIRCNAVNPDGVVTGSGIWSDAWKEQTAKSLGIDPSELVEYYKNRSLLGVAVTPDDCAEAIAWLVSDARSSRTTGAVIPVDGGNREGLLR
ncbi:MAG TPA: bifunctional rhamnulose-1-phosphate aldolase/short-chain dehydrogenase [Fimbriimonadaceae bacterium]|nr:bifunctional rhamnulose-1-phosphate aldolase/short-chain dehydrogenase [Fimbriimonadaceae bacterium]